MVSRGPPNGAQGAIYRPLITAKHFANDRPNRGPIFRFRCTTPHETIIFCLFFWQPRFSRKRKMDHFVGKCTFGALFRRVKSRQFSKKNTQISRNFRPDFQDLPKPAKTRCFGLKQRFSSKPLQSKGKSSISWKSRNLALFPHFDPNFRVGMGSTLVDSGPPGTWILDPSWEPDLRTWTKVSDWPPTYLVSAG